MRADPKQQQLFDARPEKPAIQQPLAVYCRVCGRRLSHPKSKAAGVGPVCKRPARTKKPAPAQPPLILAEN